MLEMRPDCERCGVDPPPDLSGAFICSFECTFCAECGGELVDRPARPRAKLEKFPASTARRYKP